MEKTQTGFKSTGSRSHKIINATQKAAAKTSDHGTTRPPSFQRRPTQFFFLLWREWENIWIAPHRFLSSHVFVMYFFIYLLKNYWHCTEAVLYSDDDPGNRKKNGYLSHILGNSFITAVEITTTIKIILFLLLIQFKVGGNGAYPSCNMARGPHSVTERPKTIHTNNNNNNRVCLWCVHVTMSRFKNESASVFVMKLDKWEMVKIMRI